MKREILERKPFLVMEGGTCAGKTTQIGKIRSNYPDWEYFREPGGTEFGEAMREAVQQNFDWEINPVAALLAYSAARANLVREKIGPLLEAGETVVLDRYWYSTAAYQGSGEGVSQEEIREISLIATGGLEPRLVLFYDLVPELALERKGLGLKGDLDRYDLRALDFRSRVRKKYLEMAKEMKDYWVVIDASKNIEDVYRDTLEALDWFGFLK